MFVIVDSQTYSPHDVQICLRTILVPNFTSLHLERFISSYNQSNNQSKCL